MHALGVSFLALVMLVVCGVPPNQKNSLLALYNATSGGNWLNQWNVTADPCEPPGWYGVGCTNGNTTVSVLNLKNNHLFGTLPDLDLGDLQHLWVTQPNPSFTLTLASKALVQQHSFRKST